jgi:hypothetical protein
MKRAFLAAFALMSLVFAVVAFASTVPSSRSDKQMIGKKASDIQTVTLASPLTLSTREKSQIKIENTVERRTIFDQKLAFSRVRYVMRA